MEVWESKLYNNIDYIHSMMYEEFKDKIFLNKLIISYKKFMYDLFIKKRNIVKKEKVDTPDDIIFDSLLNDYNLYEYFEEYVNRYTEILINKILKVNIESNLEKEKVYVAINKIIEDKILENQILSEMLLNRTGHEEEIRDDLKENKNILARYADVDNCVKAEFASEKERFDKKIDDYEIKHNNLKVLSKLLKKMRENYDKSNATNYKKI